MLHLSLPLLLPFLAQPLELGLAATIGLPPVDLEPSAILQAAECRIE